MVPSPVPPVEKLTPPPVSSPSNLTAPICSNRRAATKKKPGQPATGLETSVLNNLQKLEQARKIYRKAERAIANEV